LKPNSSAPNQPVYPQPGDVYEIPVEGSLGLLALGYRGLVAWREKRAEVFQQMQQAEGEQQTTETSAKTDEVSEDE
jgi:CO/xanthine dehydrogenase Mo-binding subunit